MGFDELSAVDLLQALPDASLVIDSEGQIVAGNSGANVLLATDSVPLGSSILEFLPEQERRRLDPLVWLRRWAESPNAPELTHVRLWCRDRNGEQKAVRVRVGPLGTPSRLCLVTLVDVTEQQAREYRARSAHRLAARVLAVSADAIINVDQTHRIVYANPSADALFGYPAGALLGQSLSALLPERFRAAHDEFMRRFAAESAPSRLMGQRAEICGLTRDGQEIPLEASIAKVTMDTGVVFSANVRDLRPRKVAEKQLQGTRACLQAVFEHASQPMALLTSDGCVEAMNSAGRRLMARDMDPIGRPFADLPFLSDDPPGTAVELGRAIATVLSGEFYRTSVRLPAISGGEHHLSLVMSPVVTDYTALAVIVEAFEQDQERR